MTLCVTGGALLAPGGEFEAGDAVIEGDRIAHVGLSRELPGAEVIDARGLWVAPGFIELQLNGGFGFDFTARPETIWTVASQLPRFGITAFLPTIITSPAETIAAARRVLAHERPPDFFGAQPLGLHLEGPFLNPLKKGAHNPEHLRPPDARLAADWSPERGVMMVTLAPELPGALELASDLAGRGVLVSAGHSAASYEEARAGFAAGIRYGTHLFNAMSALQHREPGLPGALLAEQSVVAGLIADGVHVHPALIKLAWQAKGAAGLNLVSDAMAALGMPPGTYRLGDFDVHVTATDARLASGSLAGSILQLDHAVANLVQIAGCSAEEAIATVTSTPARLLGLQRERGGLQAGMIADLVLLTPALEVVATIAAGRVVYRRSQTDPQC